MNRWIVPALVFAAAGLFVSLASLLWVAHRREQARVAAAAAVATDPLAPDPTVVGFSIPEFNLIDSAGNPVDQSLFDGHVVICDFIFTNCPFVCPGMSQAMAELHRRLAGSNVRLVSFSVDPARDTPARLTQYASLFDADTSRWHFLTGDRAQVERILIEALAFQLQEQPERPITTTGGEIMSNIMHPPHLVLVGPDRRLLGLYLYQDPEGIRDLAARALAADEKLRSSRR